MRGKSSALPYPALPCPAWPRPSNFGLFFFKANLAFYPLKGGCGIVTQPWGRHSDSRESRASSLPESWPLQGIQVHIQISNQNSAKQTSQGHIQLLGLDILLRIQQLPRDSTDPHLTTVLPQKQANFTHNPIHWSTMYKISRLLPPEGSKIPIDFFVGLRH